MKTSRSPARSIARLMVRQSQGQIIVVFAGGLVALLLIGALVVDIGFVFAMKRHEQDAADPGAVAAARYIYPTLDTSAMWTAACFYAIENGFQATRTDTSAPCPGVGTADGSTITVNYPPSEGAGEFAGKLGYVEVVIDHSHDSFIAGLIGLGQIPVSSAAVAANDRMTGGSSSLVALNPHKCSSAKVNGGGGGGGITIFPATGVTDPGGYIQINSDCGNDLGAVSTDDACGDASKGAITFDGGTTLVAPALFVRGACDQNGTSSACSPGPPVTGVCIDLANEHPDPDLDEGASYVGDPLALIRPPSPTDLPTRQCGTGPPSTALSPKQCMLKDAVTLEPGTYYGGWKIGTPGASVTLNPGIYIIAGGGIDDTGGILTSAAGRVLIFSTDASQAFEEACIAGTQSTMDGCQQKLSMAGGGRLDLTGLDLVTPCPPYSTSGCPYGGMLLWQDGRGSAAAIFATDPNSKRCDIAVGGSSSLNLSGTIYAACGEVSILGNDQTTGCDVTAADRNCAAVQIISDTWQVGGAAVLEMPYDPNAFYHLSLKGLVR
ncbi:MAG: pilus assembly protein TadG-related protein [Chloroflexota bacterium]